MIPEDLKRPKKGGRPSDHSIMLDEDELDWITSTFARKAALIPQAKKSPKKLKDCILSVNDKLAIPGAADVSGRYALKLSRDELQVLNQLVKSTTTLLQDKILPEYAKRHEGHPRQVEAFATYSMLLDLQEKGERIYDNGSHRRGNSPIQKPGR